MHHSDKKIQYNFTIQECVSPVWTAKLQWAIRVDKDHHKTARQVTVIPALFTPVLRSAHVTPVTARPERQPRPGHSARHSAAGGRRD